MKPFIMIFLFASFSACGQAIPKANNEKVKITRNIQKDINNLIPNGDIKVDIMDKVTMSPRRQELQAKFMQAVKENALWFMEQQKLVESTGQEIQYDSRLGMTETEWNDYKNLMNNMNDMQAVSSGTEIIKVTKSNGIISFKAEGKLSYLNSITIDPIKNSVKVLKYNLLPTDTISVTNADNVFRSSWRGYKWQFSDPVDASMPTSQEGIANFSMTIYSVTLGLFDKTGKTYMEISGSETRDGKQALRFKVPFIFQ